MRVIAGEKRGTHLLSFENELIRPTIDRVKESMFNIIQFELLGNVLDLFAGTGQLGIEALSRGADKAVFCDNNINAIELIKNNLDKTHFTSKAKVYNADYKKYLRHICDMKFNTVLLDPPYNSGLSEKSLQILGEGLLLEANAVVVLECQKSEAMPEVEGVLSLKKRYNYGQVSVLIYNN